VQLFVLLVSEPILAEVEHGSPPEPKRHGAGLAWRHAEFSPDLRARGHRVVRPDVTIRMSRDPTDDKFLECAVSGAADYVVSADDDLLSLREVRGIPILDAPTFWRRLAEHGDQG